MAIFASQAQNFDPEPWVCPDETFRTTKRVCWRCEFDPRPEYENRVNPVLSYYRENGQPFRIMYRDMPVWPTEAEIEHSNKVLKKLAAFRG